MTDNKYIPQKENVAGMFNNIAGKYDFLNHFLSLGIDKLWRRKAISIIRKLKHEKILDVATGTGDFAIAASKLKPQMIIGIDISEKMLEKGIEKVNKLGLNKMIKLEKGDSENIRYDDNIYDIVTVAFGVRNFENLKLGLSEINRVLKPEGRAVILEFSKPRTIIIKQLYIFYFTKILPLIGNLVSKDSNAYTYLPKTVMNFPDNDDFLKILGECGFKNEYFIKQSMGIAAIYVAEK